MILVYMGLNWLCGFRRDVENMKDDRQWLSRDGKRDHLGQENKKG
jgi:hypothetical protein